MLFRQRKWWGVGQNGVFVAYIGEWQRNVTPWGWGVGRLARLDQTADRSEKRGCPSGHKDGGKVG